MNIHQLVRPNVLKLQAYSSARSLYTSGTLLDANESPYDIFGTDFHLNRYPDGSNPLLRNKIASLTGVTPAQVSVSNGSDELIDQLIRIFCEPRVDSVAICSPTFGMYRACAELNDVRVIEVPLKAYDLDIEALKTSLTPSVKIIFLCNPNNPTGTLYSREKLTELFEFASCIVVVDEAYIDFAPQESALPQLAQYPNLVILRTLSKAYAMAGVRLGIALASLEITELITKVKMPYNISVPVASVVLSALSESERVAPLVRDLSERRERVRSFLVSSSLVENILPSATNFLCVKFFDERLVFESLIRENIVLRRLSGPLSGYLRISVGSEPEMELLLSQLIKIAKAPPTSHE